MRDLSPPSPAALFICALLVVAPEPVHPQEPTPASAWKFLPPGNRFRPLAASWQEARLGVRKQMGSSRMRLDIGAGMEFLRFSPPSPDSIEFRASAEFFAYGLSTSIGGHRLQIDAIDGHFGGSLLLFLPRNGWTFTARLRMLHLSSHFVDGHDRSGNSPDNRLPIPFTRDFGELTLAPDLSAGPFALRPYVGISYSTLVRPDDLARWGGLAGIELYHREIPGELFGDAAALYAALHCALEGNPAPLVSASADAGICLGKEEGPVIRLFVGYFRGNDVFHQYYDLRREFWSLGIALEVR